MKQRNYEAIVAGFRQTKPVFSRYNTQALGDAAFNVWYATVQRVAYMLKTKNNSFDMQQFIEACTKEG